MEILTRGLLLVGFRGSASEALSWFWTSFLFGMIHALNLFFGQSLMDTMQQVVAAFLLGSALYVTRMATGALREYSPVHVRDCSQRAEIDIANVRACVAQHEREIELMIGELDETGLVAIGAGEGAAAIAEELALEEVVRDRRAVDRLKGPTPPGQSMNAACDDQLQ